MNLTVKEVSKLLNISERAVQKAVSAGKYKSIIINGVGRGGKQLLISLESLPQEIQRCG
ncbi:MAG: helix-turn-helix domain-containing protein [Alistipes senegalensis]|nr:helix-turn-helix domain-containing protein [Alistipes senegalensis]